MILNLPHRLLWDTPSRISSKNAVVTAWNDLLEGVGVVTRSIKQGINSTLFCPLATILYPIEYKNTKITINYTHSDIIYPI